MTAKLLNICERAVRSLDDYAERGPIPYTESAIENPRRKPEMREAYQPSCPLLEAETNGTVPFPKHQPGLMDCHDPDLVHHYRRPKREKIIRLPVEESFHPYRGDER